MLEINIIAEIFVGLFLAAIIGAVSFMGVLYKCSRKQNARGVRQSRGILALTSFISFEKKRLHPEETFRDIEKEIKSTLTDEHGNY